MQSYCFGGIKGWDLISFWIYGGIEECEVDLSTVVFYGFVFRRRVARCTSPGLGNVGHW